MNSIRQPKAMRRLWLITVAISAAMSHAVSLCFSINCSPPFPSCYKNTILLFFCQDALIKMRNKRKKALAKFFS